MSQPSLNIELYPTIAPEALQGSNKGKIAVVTGAARGIGKAIAEALAKTGADLAILDLDVERQQKTVADCVRHQVKTVAYACDVTKWDEVEKVSARIASDFGPIDILVNNAGRNPRLPMEMETFGELWNSVDLNLKAALMCLWQVLPSMKERGEGCIINIASRAGTVTIPFATAYSMAKYGLIRATGCLQTELELDGFGDKIHLYALHPGAVKTDMVAPIHSSVQKKYPEIAAKWTAFQKDFKVKPELCGQTCAFLSTGRGKVLRGKYFDCEQDIGTVVAAGEEGLRGLYDLKVDFLGGLPNDGGTAISPMGPRK